MSSPVSILLGNIIHTFENVEPSSLNTHQRETASGRISRTIVFDNGTDIVKVPFVNFATREINIQETYLSHLWALIYSVMVLHEEGIQKPYLNNTFQGVLAFTSPLLQRAWMLFNWSISLSSRFSEWDETLPNPRSHYNNDERCWAGKINNIFQSSVAYVLFHECAHLVLGHDSFLSNPMRIDHTAADCTEMIQMENEADEYAFRVMIKEEFTEKQRVERGISILMVVCSALLLTNQPTQIRQYAHPDIEQRILNVLQRLKFSTNESEFYCWHLCAFVTRLYFLKHDIPIRAHEYETAKDLFFAHLNVLDRIKQGNGTYNC